MSTNPTPFVRANVAFGLIAIVVSLLIGALMGAGHDFEFVREFVHATPVRGNNIMYAHVHLGVIGLANVALGFVLPWTRLTRFRAIVTWAAVASAFLVAAGFVLDDPALRPANEKLMYLRMAGFLTLTFATVVTLWNLRTDVPEARS